MTIITAAIKNGEVCIASDTQSNFGSTKVNARYMLDHHKLFEVNGNIIGLTGWIASTQILEHLMDKKPNIFQLNNRWEIFEFLLALQKKLKNKYFIETNEDNDQPVESNQLDGIIINKNGIFSFGSYREVHQWNEFWALGSGRRFALGAMHALYDTNANAEQIAAAGAAAAANFDDSCDLPIETKVLKVRNHKQNNED